MERHHKAAILASSSSSPAVFNQNPVVIRAAEVKRNNRWPAKILSVIQLAFIAFFLICFVCQLWCLWRLPQEQDAYPDGFSPCPLSSYKILDDRNITIRCRLCIECPSGQQPVPPCGSTTQSRTSSECRTCPSDTYKEAHGTGRCKPCLTCGLRQTISRCTSEKNTYCGECPRGFYQQDYTMESCKSCSTCCGIKRFAELECIYLKQCKRTNCTQQTENDKSHVSKLEKVAKMFVTPGRITQQRRMINQSVSQSDNSEGARNSVMGDIVSMLKKTKFRREVNMTIQNADTDKYAKERDEDEIKTPKDDHRSPPTTATVDGDDGTASSFTTQSKLQEGLDTVPDYSVIKPTLPLTPSYFSNFKALLATLVALVSIVVVVLVLIALLIAWKRPSGQPPGGCCTVTCCVRVYLDGEESVPFKTECDFQEISHVVDPSEKGAANVDFEGLALSDISLDLENKLIMKLDVRHKGEYGWQTVGKAFGIDRDRLKYLETAYKRGVESPTKELLEILDKCQGRTVGDLINKLEGPKVNRPDVALLIRQQITTARS